MLLILPRKSASSVGVRSAPAATSSGSSASLKNILLPDRRDDKRDDNGGGGDGTMYAVAAKPLAMPMDTTILAILFMVLGWGRALSRK